MCKIKNNLKSEIKDLTPQEICVLNLISATDELSSYLGMAKLVASNEPLLDNLVHFIAKAQADLIEIKDYYQCLDGSRHLSNDIFVFVSGLLSKESETDFSVSLGLAGDGELQTWLRICLSISRRAERFSAFVNRNSNDILAAKYFYSLSQLLAVFANKYRNT